MKLNRSLAPLLLLSALVATPAWAGPPLICHTIDIGSQRSLPWRATGGWNGTDSAYDLARLPADTLALLSNDAPIEVRMETLRRAVIYSSSQPALADRLSIELLGRVTRSETIGKSDPDAWFDAGYFIETLREGAQLLHVGSNEQSIDGLALMRMAVRLGGSNMQAVVATIEGRT